MKTRKIIFLLIVSCPILFQACNNEAPRSADHESLPFLIAYNVAMDEKQSDYDVWTVDPETGEKKNITRHPTDVAWTYLATDDKVLYISDRDTCTRCFFLYETDAEGNTNKKITDFLLRDSWMGARKNGSELIVNPQAKIDSAFYIINREGQVLDKIYTGLAYSNDPVFSPDGTKIAFRGAHKKSKREEGFNEAIYLINVDGSGLKQLSNYPADDSTAPWYAYKAGAPRWHPTENFISYQSMQNGKYSLYAVSPDGKKQWKLTENLQEEGWHDWSPDGKWLAIELFDADQTQFHIGLMDWDTKEMEILTDTSYQYQQAPVFISK